MVSTIGNSSGCILFFPSCFQSSMFSLPASSLPGKFWSYFFTVSNNIKLYICPLLKSSKWSVTSVQCLLSLTHQLLSFLKLTFYCLKSFPSHHHFPVYFPNYVVQNSNFKSLFQVPFTPCHMLLSLMLSVLILGIFLFALLLQICFCLF